MILLQDIRNLSGLKKLKRLVVLGNSLAKDPKYRLKIINALPHLKMLDFKKVTAKVRVKSSSTASAPRRHCLTY